MLPFHPSQNSSPTQEQQASIEKKFDISKFDPSQYKRIEDMPEEARGYFMSVPKNDSGEYGMFRSNTTFKKIEQEKFNNRISEMIKTVESKSLSYRELDLTICDEVKAKEVLGIVYSEIYSIVELRDLIDSAREMSESEVTILLDYLAKLSKDKILVRTRCPDTGLVIRPEMSYAEYISAAETLERGGNRGELVGQFGFERGTNAGAGGVSYKDIPESWKVRQSDTSLKESRIEYMLGSGRENYATTYSIPDGEYTLTVKRNVPTSIHSSKDVTDIFKVRFSNGHKVLTSDEFNEQQKYYPVDSYAQHARSDFHMVRREYRIR